MALAAEPADCHRPVVELDNVTFSFGDRTVIDGLRLTVRERDFVGIIGPNGSGKTTLLRLGGRSGCSASRRSGSGIGT